MKILKPFLSGVQFSLGIVATIGLVGISLAAWNATMPSASPGSPLTSTGWNAVVDNVNDLNGRLTNLTNKNVWSVITRWWVGTSTSNATLLYSGWAFANHYANANNYTPVCLQWGDPGSASANAASAYWALLYPVGTGDSTRMPPGVTASTQVRCSRLYVAWPTYENFGSNSCPSGWNVIYSGYAMSGYYNHTGDVNSMLCVDAANYDSSNSWAWTSGGTYLSAAYVWTGPDATNYPVQRYVKCAVCGKY